MTKPEEVAVVKLVSGNRTTLPQKVVSDLGVSVGSELFLLKQRDGWLLTSKMKVIP